MLTVLGSNDFRIDLYTKAILNTEKYKGLVAGFTQKAIHIVEIFKMVRLKAMVFLNSLMALTTRENGVTISKKDLVRSSRPEDQSILDNTPQEKSKVGGDSCFTMEEFTRERC